MENSITEGPEKAMKLAIITSQSLRDPTAASLARLQKLQPDYETVLLTYENFAQLPALYDEYAPSVDGFLVSGQVTLAAIERKEHAVRKPLLHFQADTAELYTKISLAHNLLSSVRGTKQRCIWGDFSSRCTTADMIVSGA